jgi:hypothetical protein
VAEFFNFLTNMEINSAIVIMLMLFGAGIAIFHSVLILAVLEVNIKPSWIFFILNPALIGITFLINSKYTFLVFALLFVSVFIIGFYTMIKLSIKGYKEDAEATRKFNKRYDIAPTPRWKKILRTLVGFAVIALLFSSGVYAFVIIFAYVILEGLLPSSKGQFLKLQATLPTSRIRSVAMGLAEVEGTLKMIEPVIAPIKDKECIGFVYHIDKVSKNSDGDKSYSNVFTKTKVKPFIIKDETGEMKVIPDKLEFVWIAEEDRYERSGKRYTQYLLKEGDEVLMMGKASLENNKPVLTYESIKDIFAISPLAKVLHYNIYKPLLNSFVLFSALFAFISALILVSPVSIKNNQLVIEKPIFIDHWKDIHRVSYLWKIFHQQGDPVSSGNETEEIIEIDPYYENNNVHDQLENNDLMNDGIIEGPR